MVRSIILSAALAFGLATVASAAITPAPIGKSPSLVSKVAEGCGRGWYRAWNGHCYPMARGRWCPRGYRLAPDGRCWPI